MQGIITSQVYSTLKTTQNLIFHLSVTTHNLFSHLVDKTHTNIMVKCSVQGWWVLNYWVNEDGDQF